MDIDNRARTMQVISGLVDMLVAKNKAYGAENILFTGLDGISVRILDKAWRIANLSENAQAENHYESILDTYRDIFGYCVIGMAVLDNKWRAWDDSFAGDLTRYATLMTGFDMMVNKQAATARLLILAKELYKSNRGQIEVAWLLRTLMMLGRNALFCLLILEDENGPNPT